MTTRKILVADADPVAARFVEALLRGRGHEVVLAVDAGRALELAREGDVDLIVADISLPHRNGSNVLHALRADAALDGIPIVIVSMRDREEEIVRAFEDGADEYVTKPFRARELVIRIERRLPDAARVG
jgi:two-component system KDP operon response regulator KdpE